MKKNILIIDDSRPIRMLLHVILSQKFEVSAVSNALEAMEWLNNGNMPDLIISDIQMPEINGWEFISNLRTSLLYDAIPIIVLSGAEKIASEIDCHFNGIVDYVQKPFDPKILLQKIDQALFGKYVSQ